MDSTPTKWSRLNFLTITVFLQVVVYLTVFFDIPIARQVLGFLYFTFFPGFIILRLLKLDELGRAETILFSAGFSLAFLMVAGLSMSVARVPLSIIPLMMTLNGVILVGGVLVYLKRENLELGIRTLWKSPSALLFVVLPILSILGAIWVRTYESNLLLLFMMVMIASLFAVAVLSKRFMHPRLYPFAVVMIAVCLLFHSALISDHMVHFGSDVPGEVFAFRTVENNGYWSPFNPYSKISDTSEYSRSLASSFGRTYGMLSVTVLPVIYSNLLNADGIWVFKALYPLIFSLVPLGLYIFWSRFIDEKYAFVSAFLFMAYNVFYTEMLGLNKQIIGELFFVLLLLVILSKKMEPINKTLCFFIFGFGLVVSHYALAEIFLGLVSFVLVSLFIMKKPSRKITLALVLIFFTVMFAWYWFTSGEAVLSSFVSFGINVKDQLGEFFNPASRGETVLIGLGLEAAPTIWNTMSRVFAYLTQVLIVVGFFGLVTKRVRFHFELEYFLLNLFSVTLLAALVLVPGLADTLNMTRFYHILLLFLAPLCTLGVETILSIVGRHKTEMMASFLLLAVLIPYFFFQVGFVYEVVGNDSWMVPLSGYRMPPYRLYGALGYTTAYSISGAEWVSRNVDHSIELHRPIYSDAWARATELRAYGSVYIGYVETLSNTTGIATNGIVYLSSLNIIEETVISNGLMWNTSELHLLSDLSTIYSNGGCEVYGNKP